ncbi:MAG: hypothetical protein LBM99_06115 [Bacillales bacterium]|jgi:pullulanase|nr:hypothetical protein [Bacillales bacterium]
MKKILLFLFSAFLLTSCIRGNMPMPSGYVPPIESSSSSSDDNTSESSSEDVDENVHIPDKLTIHYHQDDGQYGNKRFYVWAGGVDGKELPTYEADEFGIYYTFYPKTDYPTHYTFNYIIKNANTWSGQSTDTVISYSDFPPILTGEDYYELEVFSIYGSGGEIEVYPTLAEASGDRFIDASLLANWKTISIKSNQEGKVNNWALYALDSSFYALDSVHQTTKKEEYKIQESSNNFVASNSFDITLGQDADPNVVYQITGTFVSDPTKLKLRNVSMINLYETDKFVSDYTYNGDDLGASYTTEATTFKLWAPTSAKVDLYIYYVGTPAVLTENPSENKANDMHATYPMNKTSKGVWSLTLTGNQAGYFYNYMVTNSEGANEVVDPYAHAAGLNGVRGAIVDFSQTNPANWSDLPLKWDGTIRDISAPSDLVVSEVHIRDLTMDSTWNGTLENAGNYRGFYESGTTYTKSGTTVKTGFDHLEELGVNAVQVLPFFDADNEERLGNDSTGNPYRKFNWGYNPLNYSVLDGAFSNDPASPTARINEFKELVSAYANNANKTRIIMDVVYNHVSSVSGSNFTKIVPKYYFRTNAEGFYTNGSGVGNETKSEAPMFRKFIVDSLKWWATEYKIKGFRFDLMGLIDVETMRQVKEALYLIDPDIVIYGEGWTGDGSHYNDANRAITSSIYASLYHSEASHGSVGAFNDAGRNAIRGGNNQGWGGSAYPGYGFISQGSGDLSTETKLEVADMLRGITTGKGGNPYQTINYASCHDNYTLYDQLYSTLSNDGGNTAPSNSLVAQASVAVNGAIILSQGISFLNGGEEIFRSKKLSYEDIHKMVNEDGEEFDGTNGTPYTNGEEASVVNMYGDWISHNSYNMSDATNSYKYDRKIDLLDYFNEYKEIISLRKQISRYSFADMNNTFAFGTNSDESYRTTVGYISHGPSKYAVLLSGRGTDSNLWIPEAGSYTLIYSSLNSSSHNFDYGQQIVLNNFELVVYRIN